MRTFIGVDQSLVGTGLVVLDLAGNVLLQRLVQPAALRGMARLSFIRAALQETLDRFKPESAAFEGYSFDSVHRAFALGELSGMVQLVVFDAGIPCVEVAPRRLKKFVTGNGTADKEEMIRVTKDKWKLDFGKQDDLCDAHGLARVLVGVVTGSTLRHELEVIVDLKTPPEKTTKITKSKTKISI